MSIGVWFFCPGTPSAIHRRVYEDAARFFDAHVRVVGIPGRSREHTAEAKRLLGLGRGSVLDGLEIAYPMPVPVDRYTVVAFSAGYAGARVLLGSKRDVSVLDGLCLLDALHAGFDKDGTAADAQIAPFAEYAKLAIDGDAVFVTGHTDVKTPQPPAPAAFASTTQSHAELVRLAGPPSGHFVVRTFDQFDDQHQQAEHGAALTAWGPELMAEMLARVAGIDASERPTRPDVALPQALPVAGLSYPEVVLAAARRDLAAGVHEDLGPNDGRRIREYAARLKLRPPFPWCAAGCSTWLQEAAEALGVEPVVPGSAGAQALGAQFKERGRWLTAAAARTNPDLVLPGYVGIMHRPPHPWTGHAYLVETRAGRVLGTIEANSGPRTDRVAQMQRSLDDAELLGFGRVG